MAKQLLLFKIDLTGFKKKPWLVLKELREAGREKIDIRNQPGLHCEFCGPLLSLRYRCNSGSTAVSQSSPGTARGAKQS